MSTQITESQRAAEYAEADRILERRKEPRAPGSAWTEARRLLATMFSLPVSVRDEVEIDCPDCNATGKVERTHLARPYSDDPDTIVNVDCETCDGTGNRMVEATPNHAQDSDCDVDPETLSCTQCGVDHGSQCPVCSGRGFHKGDCPAQYDQCSAFLDPDTRCSKPGTEIMREPFTPASFEIVCCKECAQDFRYQGYLEGRKA